MKMLKDEYNDEYDDMNNGLCIFNYVFSFNYPYIF